MMFRPLFLLTLASCASVVADDRFPPGNRIMPPIGVTSPATSTTRAPAQPTAATSRTVARPISSTGALCPPTGGLSSQPVAAPPSEAELLAVDIARRALLARYPSVARQPVRTLQLQVRPEGDVLHTYARLQWTLDKKQPFHYHECEVFATLVYTPDLRRVYDISYKDNRLHPWRVFSRQVDLVSVINEELERRDTMRMATPLVGNRQSVLMPRSRRWLHHPLQGDHAWHAGAADDHISPRWWQAESAVPVK